MTSNYKWNKFFFKLNQLYDCEIESVPEFNGFEDNLKKFRIYGFDQKNEKATVVAILKVIICNRYITSYDFSILNTSDT